MTPFSGPESLMVTIELVEAVHTFGGLGLPFATANIKKGRCVEC